MTFHIFFPFLFPIAEQGLYNVSLSGRRRCLFFFFFCSDMIYDGDLDLVMEK